MESIYFVESNSGERFLMHETDSGDGIAVALFRQRTTAEEFIANENLTGWRVGERQGRAALEWLENAKLERATHVVIDAPPDKSNFRCTPIEPILVSLRIVLR